MKRLLALFIGLLLLASVTPIKANAEKVYRLYWVTYYPVSTGGVPITEVDSKIQYPTLTDCQAAQAHWAGGIRSWSNGGYYICL